MDARVESVAEGTFSAAPADGCLPLPLQSWINLLVSSRAVGVRLATRTLGLQANS